MDETRDQLSSVFYGLGLDHNAWVGDFYTQNKNNNELTLIKTIKK